MLSSGDEFVCEVRKLSVTHAAISAVRALEAGETLVCYFDSVGMVRGQVVRAWTGGFIMKLDVNEQRRPRLAACVEWHENRAAAIAEQRAAPRIVPKTRKVLVRLGEELAVPGLIVNVSISGAAIEVKREHRPFVGSLVRVGKRFATVVRLLDNGMAVRFAEPLQMSGFDDDITL
ncbi:PilZ domain-containing protein [Methylopila sp. M107]|uniref:PilZ domain-containing protein n=1 Tax=Methylopila sp. M107 TaxID=1101190 RepID=UPI00036A24C3|nr:PilZ domain-containing protein [Methylopila sp. M107]